MEKQPDFDKFRACVGILITRKTGGSTKVLVAQRIDSPGPYWQMPQGGIDPGEDLIQASLREAEEELGITENQLTLRKTFPLWMCYELPKDLRQNLWGGQYLGQAQRWSHFSEASPLEELHLSKHAPPEFLAWKWLDVKKLESVAIPFKKAIYRKLADLLISEEL